MQAAVRYTAHVLSRRAQRNLSDADVRFVIAHGRCTQAAGALHIFLADRDSPIESSLARRFGHLEGPILVLTADAGPTLITAYRH